MKRTTLLSLVALALAMGRLPAAEAPSDPPSIPSAEIPIPVDGTLIPVREVHMASRAKGVIRFIREEGERVHPGDPLLILEDSVEKLEVDRQKKILELRQVESSSEEQLRKKDVVSAMELAEKRLDFELSQINLAQAEEILALRTVPSPFEGVVTQRTRNVGEAVDELSPVLTMVDIDNLYLEVHLPAGMRDRVKAGENVTIHVDTPVPADAKGTVQLLSPVINPASGDFKVRVLIPNPGGRLTAGVRAQGIISTSSPSAVPAASSPSPTPVTAASP